LTPIKIAYTENLGNSQWPVAKLVRIDYPTVQRAVWDIDNFSMYFGYENASPNRCSNTENLCSSNADCPAVPPATVGGQCGAGVHNGDYGEVTCRTLPINRLMSGN